MVLEIDKDTEEQKPARDDIEIDQTVKVDINELTLITKRE